MPIAKNKLVPVLGVLGLAVIVVILVIKFSGGHSADKAAQAQTASAKLPPARGADQDNSNESLKQVVVENKKLRDDVQKVVTANDELRATNKKLQQALDRAGIGGGLPPATSPVGSPATPDGAGGATYPATTVPASPATDTASAGGTGNRRGVRDSFGQAIDNASRTLDGLTPGSSGARSGQSRGSAANTGASNPSAGGNGANDAGDGDGYQVLRPMGYTASAPSASGSGKATPVSYAAPAVQSAVTAAQAAAARKPIPYFTLPENATLVGAVSMTSIIGRVPVDGRVTDPMQFKLVIGRDNLAANGFDLPQDIAGMIVTGIAIGDMTLSCSEGKIYSATFVFNDGTVRTTSVRRPGSAQAAQSAGGDDLGYISDMHGNPCIQGKFVTNAPAFLTDVTAMQTLSALGQAYAAAQQTVTQSATTGTTSAITGNMGSYALGQAVSSGASEVTKWLLQREKSSFDAVVTPSGQKLVVHLDRQIDIDKDPNGRKLVHRQQESPLNTGVRYGLE